VFTPWGNILARPRGATAVDFAYGVHTDIGHHCVAARINYELLPLRTELKNGDHVEILTAPTARPNPSWLSFVATGKARSRIRHYLKGLQQKESAALGERLLNQALATLKVEPEAISWDRWEALAKEYGAKSQLDILADIGLGKRLSFVVAQALTRQPGRDEALVSAASAKGAGSLTLRGVEGVAIQYAKCCRPIPGDAIVAQFRKGQGLVVHQRDCPTLRKQRIDGTELVDVEWAPDVAGVFEAGVRALVADRRGLLAELATVIANADVNIDTVSMERPDGGEVLAIFFGMQVHDRRHLAKVMRALKRVPEVRRIARART
jgi:GTP pyrophosphokinase